MRIILAALLLAGCTATSPTAAEPTPGPTTEAPEPTPEPTTETPSEPDVDTLARAACRHWRNIVADIEAGILTDDEIRTKIQEVHADARLSDEATIVRTAEALLRAATQVEGFSDAAIEFTEACIDTGAL